MARPVLITVNGTAVPDPFGPGFSGDIGRAMQVNPWRVVCDKLDGLAPVLPEYDWQPIGYPAATFPIGPSVQAGRAEVVSQIRRRPRGTKTALSGYSQGALVVDAVWEDDILNPAGVLHERLDDVVGIVNFGDPERCPGIANGNKVAGLALPAKLNGQTTGGIAGPRCLTAAQTPDFLLSCALDGDLYAAAPVGDNPWSAESGVGAIETRIYNFVLSGSFQDFLANAKVLAELFTMPLQTVIALGEAIFNGMKFLVQGQSAPHWKYEPFFPAVVDWLRSQV